jgi:hypothetical protein
MLGLQIRSPASSFASSSCSLLSPTFCCAWPCFSRSSSSVSFPSVSRLRLARNQVVFREVNEPLREVADGAPDGRAEYLCGCSSVECTAKIELDLAEYEAVRSVENRFVILPGHEHLAVERVVEGNHRYMLVEKLVPVDGLESCDLSDQAPWPASEV